ncbi:MAG: hypothetical protein COW24_04055 [Candidatus Kerfeldbacteria bacterium CG15_BIG_FIL_POST_REV_8_21_14_020_45_12]|uniref:PKD domain-containing protein n=1 Tax=Candidatus Kerfeldbacteria bacterium CG15_BIG_FIL_POST_REV_8_21_14_020_45_12 TaxID=2014247 RepID=A0A2M7H3C5_9BACT|nr:MAG: hypothetical protein COW24_04055 [Candidatus Kerfeldbacteria bacterium CG15_BIG_FIL_POST_REV_8_21_14_020_45_12]PJA93860.1 MAG: hypothetical protein CO132_01200 [Candidatus Kerfeldbacteria bacterium CG_4_9_14_3_um_filter_45_8]
MKVISSKLNYQILAVFFTASILIGVMPATSLAQEVDADQVSVDEAVDESLNKEPLNANAGEDVNVGVGRTILFDASASTGREGKDVSYVWDFGDGNVAGGIDATYAYDSPGTYRVTLDATVGEEGDDNYEASSASIIVSVQDTLMLLITDQSVDKEALDELHDYALTQGVLLITVRDSGVDQEFLTVQNIAQKLAKKREDVVASDIIITWTAGNVGLNSLIELSRIEALSGEDSIQPFGFPDKAIVAINNDQSLNTSARTAQSTFQSINPRYIVVSDEKILDDVIRAKSPESLQASLNRVDANHQLINAYTERGLRELGPFNFMSYAMNYMINKGVPVNSLYLILMLPLMATVIAAGRQLVGIKAFGIFAPTVIALTFLATGLKYGITVFAAIIVLGTLGRLLARKFRVLYLPRMALVLSFLALAIFFMFLLGAVLGKTGFITISIFPILIMTVLTEHFVSVQVEQGYKTAVKLTLETLALSVIGFFIGDWTLFKTTILAYPELILLTLLFNYFMGKFSGLRLMEYIRFHKVLKQMKHGEKQN